MLKDVSSYLDFQFKVVTLDDGTSGVITSAGDAGNKAAVNLSEKVNNFNYNSQMTTINMIWGLREVFCKLSKNKCEVGGV